MNRRNFLDIAAVVPFIPKRHIVNVDDLDSIVRPETKPEPKRDIPPKRDVPNGIQVATQCFISVNGVDISDHILYAELKTTQQGLEYWRGGFLPGLKEQTLEIEMLTDFADEADSWQRFDGASEIRFRPYCKDISLYNPESMFQARLVSVNRGAVQGALMTTKAAWQVVGDIGSFSF